MPSPRCEPGGAPCSSPLSCCSLVCEGGLCSSERCAPDGEVCATNELCCSGACDEGVCTSLTNKCLTVGNPCASSSQCCSGLCSEGLCDPRGSYCQQTDDSCSEDSECCSGTCQKEPEALLGICGPPPQGPSNCSSGIAGSLCSTCNDCCSRICAPFGTAGTMICLQATGCRQTGELCRTDSECCGGVASGTLPGAGNVTCEIEPEQTFGICRNAQACSPQGNVCHLRDYACTVSAAANRCCAAEGAVATCELDASGVPRCNGLGDACLLEGEPCAFEGDCCEGMCRPDPSGQLLCQSYRECAVAGESCASTSECCPGRGCRANAESDFGVCEIEPWNCSLLGQLCGSVHPECCGSLECVGGRCAQ